MVFHGTKTDDFLVQISWGVLGGRSPPKAKRLYARCWRALLIFLPCDDYSVIK
jgi:hypothetical protein